MLLVELAGLEIQLPRSGLFDGYLGHVVYEQEIVKHDRNGTEDMAKLCGELELTRVAYHRIIDNAVSRRRLWKVRGEVRRRCPKLPIGKE